MTDEQIAFANAKIMEQLILMRQLILEDDEKKLIKKYDIVLRQNRNGFEISVEITPYRLRGGATSSFLFSTMIGMTSLPTISQILSPCISGYRDYRLAMMPVFVLSIPSMTPGGTFGI